MPSISFRVLRAKYVKGDDLQWYTATSADSAQWRGLISVQKKIYKGIKKKMVNGRDTSLWHDPWVVSGEALSDLVPGGCWTQWASCSVADVVDDNGPWKVEFLQALPDEARQRVICTLPPNKNRPGEDSFAWCGTANGKFSLGSAYKILHRTGMQDDANWKRIWRIQVPPRVRTFAWLVKHEALMTNVRRVRMGLADNTTRPMCEAEEESVLHLLRDCTFAGSIWQVLIKPCKHDIFFGSDLQNWIKLSLSENLSAGDEQLWYSTFVFTLRYLWRRRNLYVFQNEEPYNGDLVLAIKRMVQENRVANELRSISAERGNTRGANRWRRPPDGWVKLNVDGAVCQRTQKAAIGGTLRDEKGVWMRGFSKFLGICNNVSAEIWAVLQGLQLAKEMDIRKLVVECDATEVIEAIKEAIEDRDAEEANHLLSEIKALVRGDWEVQFQATPREANKCADFLVKEALSHDPILRILDNPGREMHLLYYADYISVN